MKNTKEELGYTITTNSIEEFHYIIDKINLLPKDIKEQITSAKKTYDFIDCFLYFKDYEKNKFYVPKDMLEMIADFKDGGITIYAGTFHFHIAETAKQNTIEYILY